jgi:hypothetical protein
MQGSVTREFITGQALVDAIAAESDVDDWTELSRWHDEQRKAKMRRPRPPMGRRAKAIEHEPVTIERLERALAFCARLVVLDGPTLVPLFESLERDLAEMRAQQATVERAKRLLESVASPV